MAGKAQRFLVLIAASFLVLSAALPAIGLTTPTYPTTSLTASSMKEAEIGGYTGIAINYTSTMSSPLTAFVYLDLVNSLGQTAYVNIGTCDVSTSQNNTCFVPIFAVLPTGVYTALVFATTTTSVPVSHFSTLQISQ